MTVVNDPHGQLLSHVLKWYVGWTVCRSLLHYSANTINVDSMLAHCWGIVANGLPTLTHHRINVSYFRDTVVSVSCYKPRQHGSFTLCWFNVGPASQTVGLHWNSVKVCSLEYTDVRCYLLTSGDLMPAVGIHLYNTYSNTRTL